MNKTYWGFLICTILLATLMHVVYPGYEFDPVVKQTRTDSAGNIYLSEFDPYYWKGQIERQEVGKPFEINLMNVPGYVFYQIDKSSLYWIPVALSMVCTALIYLIAVRLISPFYSFIVASIYLLHPYRFFSSYKGFYDTNIMISLFLILGVYYLVITAQKIDILRQQGSMKKYDFLVILMALTYLVLLLAFTWSGYPIIATFFVLCICILLFFYQQQKVLAIGLGVGWLVTYLLFFASKTTAYVGVKVVSEMRPLKMAIWIDYIIVPLLLGYAIYKLSYHITSDETKRPSAVDSIILTGLIFFGLLSIWMLKFFYLFVIFYALTFAVIIIKYNNAKETLTKLVVLVGICWVPFFILISYNYNVGHIVVQNNYIEAMDKVNSLNVDILLSTWNTGSLYYPYTNKFVVNHNHPAWFIDESYGMILPEEQAVIYWDSLVNYTKIYKETANKIDRLEAEKLMGLNASNRYVLVYNSYDYDKRNAYTLYTNKTFIDTPLIGEDDHNSMLVRMKDPTTQFKYFTFGGIYEGMNSTIILWIRKEAEKTFIVRDGKN